MAQSLLKTKRPQRTPAEIIGEDRLVQLLFEGYSVVPTKDLWFKTMCGETIKGNVSWSYQWGDDGASGGYRNVPSDVAERKIIESAQAVIFHAMADGTSKLTLKASRDDNP